MTIKRKKAHSIPKGLITLQRLYKITASTSEMIGLYKEGVDSAKSIVDMGEDYFINEIAPKAGIKPREARAIYRKAVRANSMESGN